MSQPDGGLTKRNPNPGPGLAHDFHCTHDPCLCRADVDGTPLDAEAFFKLTEQAEGWLARELAVDAERLVSGLLIAMRAERDARYEAEAGLEGALEQQAQAENETLRRTDHKPGQGWEEK